MIVSWKWLGDYVALPKVPDEIVFRLAMAGLNHEHTTVQGDDFAIDLEITSNRPDCLGHIGVAREIATLTKASLKLPTWSTLGSPPSIQGRFRVRNEASALCPRYTARIIEGVKIGPSPAWLASRLKTIGIQSVNNVVDVTNYVMMECGQPLHAFDLRHLQGSEIIVRDAAQGEKFLAIDHRTYDLAPGMCVIADAKRAVAIGGVMGGAESEVGPATTDILIEAADFSPLSIRGTARALNLFSPSSYRFERGVDRESIAWASLRCCHLILQVAGGTLLDGALDTGGDVQERMPITLRWKQIRRVLGILVDQKNAKDILMALGVEILAEEKEQITVRAPSWRRDLSREIDLIEEIARIHGYEAIPENVAVPMAASHRRLEDRAVSKMRDTLVACGLHEAMTASVVNAASSTLISPWTLEPPLRTGTPMLRGADHLRRSLLPSLLAVCRENEKNDVQHRGLFEIAKIYLQKSNDANSLPEEPRMLGIVSTLSIEQLTGIVEGVFDRLGIHDGFQREPSEIGGCAKGETARILWKGECVGIIAKVSDATRQLLDLQGQFHVAEIMLEPLFAAISLIPTYKPLPSFPAVERELNLIVPEALTWRELSETVRSNGGGIMESLRYLETYRDPKRDGGDRKRLLFAMTFRAADRTLDGDEVNRACHRVIEACQNEHQAQILTAAGL